MSAIGGSIQSLTIGGRIFTPSADSEAERDLGGYKNEYESNGDGTARKIMTRKPWELSGLTVNINDDNQDAEFLQSIADSKSDTSITITYASGAVYEGQGSIADDLKTNSMKTVASLTLRGGGVLTQQL
jgi:hypothetical protein